MGDSVPLLCATCNRRLRPSDWFLGADGKILVRWLCWSMRCPGEVIRLAGEVKPDPMERQ